MKKSEIIESIIDTIVLTYVITTADKRPLLAWLFDELSTQKFIEKANEAKESENGT